MALTRLPRPAMAVAMLLAGSSLASAAQAQDASAALLERLNRLEAANARLQAEVDQLKGKPAAPAAAPAASPAYDDATPASSGTMDLVGTATGLSTRMLNHAEWTNTKNLLLLEAARDGELSHRLTLGGDVVALADWEYSNRASKFGWLMRQPTANNQVGNHASEVAVDSVRFSLTARPASFVTAYAELLYNPESSFAAGSNTVIGRNVVSVTRGFVTLGDLKRSPFYVSLGKLDVPFGQNDSVNPYTNSTSWHAFGGLANEAVVGYYAHGVHIRAAAIEGGAQFRAVNSVVNGTNVPSLVNNYAFDANYTATFGGGSLRLGASYEHGSSYCTNYPIAHFLNCVINNPAAAVYGRLDYGRLTVMGDYAGTTKAWPGTGPLSLPGYPANPYAGLPANKVQAMTLGARYRSPLQHDSVDFSFEFSRFIAGPSGTPWHRQNQWVGGLAWRLSRSVKLFGEAILTEGYAPLNFLTGGNGAGACGAATCPASSPVPYYQTWTDGTAHSNLGVLGVEAAF
ncbi:MAG: hypothetical protein JSS36_00325 [Proteobacteria bacterium]|nr:hypothetical protein [Pseudomonadota bacterium]